MTIYQKSPILKKRAPTPMTPTTGIPLQSTSYDTMERLVCVKRRCGSCISVSVFPPLCSPDHLHRRYVANISFLSDRRVCSAAYRPTFLRRRSRNGRICTNRPSFCRTILWARQWQPPEKCKFVRALQSLVLHPGQAPFLFRTSEANSQSPHVHSLIMKFFLQIRNIILVIIRSFITVACVAIVLRKTTVSPTCYGARGESPAIMSSPSLRCKHVGLSTSLPALEVTNGFGGYTSGLAKRS